ncbi:unnamed protein product [Euphydryas editha]|uniref:Reverse transcriptase domain-containing protein n=1 Tax=Euphydryas editha TaxID=104508 RepID=A0AAU9TKM0_EUPED|nr:unnamed protein product [Euphydryas editha]
MSKIRVNIRKQYVNQYGLETANKIRRLEDLQTKRARSITSLNFLKRCRDHSLIPTCVKITAKKDILGSAKILKQASQKLLCQCIRENRYNLFKVNTAIEKASIELKNILTTFDYKSCIDTLNQRETSKYIACKNRQILKYNKLLKNSNNKTGKWNVNVPASTTDTQIHTSKTSTSVVNISKQTLDAATVKVLEKGLNFAITPRRIPFEEIICNVEDCLIKNNLRKEDMEAMRQDVSSVLRRSKLPKPNLSKEESIALKNLRARSDITVLRADKGNATVVMDTSDYNTKIEQLLSDKSTYKIVNKDPTNKILKETNDLIKKYSDKLKIDVKLPTCAKSPRLYGLPKIHKINVPLRPIVSQIDSPTYKLAQHVAKVLSPLRGNTTAYVKDSYQFVSEIKDLQLTQNETMVSFDVQSLFTCLPVQDCIEIVRRRLVENDMPEEYAIILKHCLTTGYLLWNHKYYIQVDGVAMGSPVSPIVADIYMEDFEDRALKTAPISPRFYKRYVDDTFTILPTDSTCIFLEHLNSINNNIQFTMELEANNTLAFLDVLIIRNPDHSLSHSVYRKSTHTNKYLNGASHHHPRQLSAVGLSLFQRARGICDEKHLDAELQHVKQVLRDNNLRAPRQRHRSRRKKTATVERQPAVLPYVKGVTDKIGYILKRASIKTYYKPPTKISQLLPSVKCQIPLQDAGVYKLDCECGLSYIGQTKRSIETRVKEHIADMKHQRSTKSAVYQHTQQGTNHYIRFDKPQILAKEHRFLPRMIREAIEIKKHPNFNREDGWNVPPAWEPVLKLIEPKENKNTARLPDTISSFCMNRNG